MTTHTLKSTSSSWFRQSKFASFQRQLNTYGFIRIESSGTFILLAKRFVTARITTLTPFVLTISLKDSTREDSTMSPSSEANGFLLGASFA
jgi:hypothetical protein